MAQASYVLEVDWGNTGSFASDSDEIARGLAVADPDPPQDITIHVLQQSPLTWSLGRDYPSQLMGRSVAGQLTCTVLNDDGMFSRFNTASPLYGYIKPGRKVRLRAAFNGVTYAQFQGILADVQPAGSADSLAVAKLTAWGVLTRINKDKVNVAMQTSISTGAAVDDVLDAVGWPAGDRDIDAGQTTLTRWWVGGVQALTALQEIEQTEAGFLRETRDGKLAFESRHHRLTGTHLVAQATYSDTPGAGLGYRGVDQGDPLRELFNIIAVQVRTYAVQSAAVLWTLAETGANSPAIEAGQTLTYWAGYPNPQSATNAVAVDAWTTPIATTDYTANATADGSGTDLTASVSVSVSKFDKAMKIEVTNNAAVTAFLTLLRARGTPLTVSDPVTVREEDATSQSDYGEREYQVSAEWIPDTAEARDRVLFELAIRKDPLAILTVTLVANTSDDHMVEVLTRDVSDRITIQADAMTGTGSRLAIHSDFFVEHLAHNIVNGLHTLTLQCSPAEGYSGSIVLDTGPGLDTGRLGY